MIALCELAHLCWSVTLSVYLFRAIKMNIQDLPLTSLQGTILTTGPFIFFWSYAKRYVDRYGGFKWADTLYDTHNFLVAGASLVLAAHVLDIGHEFLVKRTGYQVDAHTLGYLYHLLKIYEYLDVILSVLSGNTVISKYTAFSHLALPYWSYFRVIQNDALDWRFQVITDCTVRFLSRAVPWLVPELRTEEIIVNMAEDCRWYPDLVISAFWATFLVQGRREDKTALELFGTPHKDEVTARMLSLAILLYAGQAKRKDDAADAKPTVPEVMKEEKREEAATSTSTSNDTASAIRVPQKSRRKR